MKAVYFEKPGGREVLQYGEFPAPKPQSGEALIRVKACGLNHLDVWVRQGLQGMNFPHILGSDVSGIVEEIHGESKLQVGDEVVVNPERACGACERCKSGKACEMVITLGRGPKGGYAEFVAVPLEQVYRKPRDLSFVEAAAFPLTFLTAWHALAIRAQLGQGETIFIWGASGSIGPALVQVAKLLGARVIAAARSKKVADVVKSWGADECVIYSDDDVLERVKALTDGKGVEVVFESVGEKTFNLSLAMLKPYGRIVVIGATSGERASFHLSDFYPEQFSIIGSRMGTKDEFEKVLALVEEGKLKPIIDATFLLKDAAEAQKRMEEGNHIGKIVLEIHG